MSLATLEKLNKDQRPVHVNLLNPQLEKWQLHLKFSSALCSKRRTLVALRQSMEFQDVKLVNTDLRGLI